MDKIVLISSTGGHWSQLLNIYKEFQINQDENLVEIKLITEKNNSNNFRKDTFFLMQQDRKNKLFILKFIINIFLSIYLVIKFKPDCVISTGAGVVLPYLLFSKICGSKIIFIESFAKVNSPTITGRLVYYFADDFYVQWPSMLKFYPKGIFKGSIY